MTKGSSDVGSVGSWWAYPPLRNAFLAGAFGLSGFLFARFGLIGGAVEAVLQGTAVALGAYHWAREGIEEFLAERRLGIESLMLAAAVGCGVLDLWDEAVALVVLYGVAEGVEGYTFSRTRHAIRELLDLAPKKATVLRSDGEAIVPAEDLRPGDRFVVRPGESLATDGVVVDGRSGVDESAVTGESVPVDKAVGDKVYAASINGQGALIVVVTAAFADNTLSRIIQIVEEAQEEKGRAEKWIDRFGRRYSPAVLAAAGLMVTVPWVLGVPSIDWGRRAVILFVAAAPCALVISLPIVMAAGIARAGRRGILIKGGAHLEHLGVIETVAFDKTGTLTHGRPRLTDVVGFERDETPLLAMAAALERNSEHPLARAVVAAAHDRGIDVPAAVEFEALTGSGVRAVVGGFTRYAGSPELFRDLGHDLRPLADQIDTLQDQGKTVVLVGDDRSIAGLLALEDTLRTGAAALVKRLHEMGIRTVILTGDNQRTAERVARILRIDDVRAELKPDQKVTALRELAQVGPVLMVGDGVNDAPALAAATCGMAMGAAGADAAIEAADIALMADDLGKIEEALHLGRKARRVSRQNVVFSMLVLATLIPLGLSGLTSIVVIVLAHEGSELLAVANGLRVGRGTSGQS